MKKPRDVSKEDFEEVLRLSGGGVLKSSRKSGDWRVFTFVSKKGSIRFTDLYKVSCIRKIGSSQKEEQGV